MTPCTPASVIAAAAARLPPAIPAAEPGRIVAAAVELEEAAVVARCCDDGPGLGARPRDCAEPKAAVVEGAYDARCSDELAYPPMLMPASPAPTAVSLRAPAVAPAPPPRSLPGPGEYPRTRLDAVRGGAPLWSGKLKLPRSDPPPLTPDASEAASPLPCGSGCSCWPADGSRPRPLDAMVCVPAMAPASARTGPPTPSTLLEPTAARGAAIVLDNSSAEAVAPKVPRPIVRWFTAWPPPAVAASPSADAAYASETAALGDASYRAQDARSPPDEPVNAPRDESAAAPDDAKPRDDEAVVDVAAAGWLYGASVLAVAPPNGDCANALPTALPCCRDDNDDVRWRPSKRGSMASEVGVR